MENNYDGVDPNGDQFTLYDRGFTGGGAHRFRPVSKWQRQWMRLRKYIRRLGLYRSKYHPI